jgi:hypothetical protein
VSRSEEPSPNCAGRTVLQWVDPEEIVIPRAATITYQVFDILVLLRGGSAVLELGGKQQVPRSAKQIPQKENASLRSEG